ncbi:tRNA (guanosine(37)-N1)-methyltransferase TrmD [Candidatus Falkowbacteria bacterium]|nr:tRNA (guanosine(37)-N1)-methyltransferase TrmD [Candidatus Falkowbacteria bacterium]
MMQFDILTIFPDILDSYFSKGMLRIAQEKKIIKIKTHDLRRFAVNKRGMVDDKPYGGGPGQILMVEPVVKALRAIQAQNSKLKTQIKFKNKNSKNKTETKIILLSARGKKWNQQMAQKFAKFDRLIFVCPRYEGHDERIKHFVDEEISIGDYVLTGGELGAAVIIDSITRLIPGVLGKTESLKTESHSTLGYLEYPQFTRPEVFQYKKQGKIKKSRVPEILLSGHHQKIASWRKNK